MPFKRKEAAPTVNAGHFKKTKKDPLAEKFSEIIGALKTVPLTDDLKKMVTEIMPCSLGTFSDQRTKFQEQVIEAVADILREEEAALSKKAADERSQQEAVASKESPCKKEAIEAKAALEAAKAETKRVKVDLAAKAIAFRTATASVAEAEEAKSSDAQKALDAQKKKDHLEAALEDLKVLNTIAPEEAEAREKENHVLAMLKKYKFEESMMIALPAALAKAPDARGQFDLMAIRQLEGEIGKMIVEQESILIAAKPGQDKCELALTQAQQHLDKLRLEQRVAAKNFDTASQHETTCEETSAEAHEVVQNFTKSMKHHKEAVLNAEVELEIFQQGPLEIFADLRARSTPVVEVEIVAEPVAEPSLANEEEEHAMEVAEVAVAAC